MKNERNLSRKKCLDCQVKLFPNKPSRVYVVPLLSKLTGKQWEQLQNGSGNPIAELLQINSSAGLAVNYYKLYEQTHNVTVDFEWRESIPLLKSSAPSNLDVRYELGNAVYFVESKFFEPYCDNAERNREAYFDSDRYPFDKNKDEWVSLLQKEDEFYHYDYAQMCRHLLAIYRHWVENPDTYKSKTIVLQSVSWKMTKSFMDEYGLLEDDEMLTRLEKEREKCKDLFNSFLDKIGWTDCRFEMKYYNDMLDAIKDAPKYQEFCKQYFLD